MSSAGCDLLILYPRINAPCSPRDLLELGTCLQMLRDADFNASVFPVYEKTSPEILSETVNQYNPGMVLYYIHPRHISFLKSIAPVLKETFLNIHFCCGGSLSTLDPDFVISIMGIDSLVIGEWEIPILELISSLRKKEDYSSLRNFWFKTPLLEYKKNPLRPLLEGLDILPYPDRGFYPHERLVDACNGALPIMTSRGCPCDCLFCPASHYRDIYKGKGAFYRMRSPNHVIGEILELRSRIPFSSVLFTDRIFPAKKEWLLAFSDQFHSQVNLPFHIACTVEQLDKETIELLIIAGCSSVKLGIETGNEAFRKRIANKNNGNDKIINTVKYLKDAGIAVYASYLLGLPLETEDLARESLEFNDKIAPEKTRVNVFYPVPSTSLFNYCVDKQYFSNRNPDDLAKDESILNLPFLSSQAIKDFYLRFQAANCRQQMTKSRKPAGFCDILFQFSQCDLEETEAVTCGQFTLSGQSHICLAQSPNTKLTLPITLKSQSYFKFGIGLEPTLLPFDSNASFRFTLVLIQDEKERILFEKYLKPSEEPKDFEWSHYELPIPDAKEGEALIRLEYRTSLKGTHPVRGLWRHPYITGRMSDADVKPASFTEEEFYQLQKNLLQANLLLERANQEKQNLNKALSLLENEKNDLLALLSGLEENVLRLKEENRFSREEIIRLEKIRKAYEKTLSARLKKLFRK
ncbi:radical SAM protein [Candidatus Sumerlaeota bacterium]|nr:radical SAM protein [Candidatus Sumerlaeota bacterium]